MTEVNMLLDDPELTSRGPGEEFALARARFGDRASVTLRAAISDLFPPARRRPRLTVRHLLRRAVIGAGNDRVTVFRERAHRVGAGATVPERDFPVGPADPRAQPTTARARTGLPRRHRRRAGAHHQRRGAGAAGDPGRPGRAGRIRRLPAAGTAR